MPNENNQTPQGNTAVSIHQVMAAQKQATTQSNSTPFVAEQLATAPPENQPQAPAVPEPDDMFGDKDI